ncbi:ferritin-like domain-containing protein [Novispirillum sp. DQ9]|uniref:ferritin-like domain-containing protein n=1 Tax=Novispirillum sp. DQ9 TaxID=3398612 RepID=UPI003C7E98EF
MKDLPEFLAHAITLEEESAVRFDELADALEVHHNGEVVELFRKMAHYSRLHLADARKRAEGLDLPHMAPWQYKWPDAESPETVEVFDAHYKMTPFHALSVAVDSERRGQAFYADVAATCPDAAIKALAAEFAEEEAEHVALLEGWLARTPAPADHWSEDMDPPAAVD